MVGLTLDKIDHRQNMSSYRIISIRGWREIGKAGTLFLFWNRILFVEEKNGQFFHFTIMILCYHWGSIASVPEVPTLWQRKRLGYEIQLAQASATCMLQRKYVATVMNIATFMYITAAYAKVGATPAQVLFSTGAGGGREDSSGSSRESTNVMRISRTWGLF